MIEIILVSHGNLATGILDSSKMIYGDLENVSCITLSNDGGMEYFNEELAAFLDELEVGTDVLIMADLKSGTPFNVSLVNALERKEKLAIEIVSGLNLPMLIESLAIRDDLSLGELTKRAIEAGKDWI